MKKKKILVVLFAVIGGLFLLANLAWGIFVAKSLHLRNKVEYNRIRQEHYYMDYDAQQFYWGFDDLYYMNFHSMGQIGSPAVDEQENDEFLIHYNFFKGFSYTYVYFAPRDDSFESAIRQADVRLNFNADRKLIFDADYEKYDQYAERVQDFFDKVDAMWGIK